MAFSMRTTKPGKGNKYYIRKADGGYSPAIKGSPTDSECNVLANCVGYAIGRFNEIGGYGSCKYLASVNAENFIQYKGSALKTGQTPKVGACMVWQKGATLTGADGAGHVAIVERVDSATQVYTSESGWNSSVFWNRTRTKGSDGNWGQNSTYKFLGFIYNPAISDTNTVETNKYNLRKGTSGPLVKELQNALIKLGYSCGKNGADGVFGADTDTALRNFQKKNGLTVDGIAGTQTWTAIEKALAAMATKFKVGDLVSIANNAVYWGGGAIPNWVKSQNWYIYAVGVNGRIVINENEKKNSSIMSPIDQKFLTLKKSGTTFSRYNVRVTANALNYRSGPGTNYKINGVIRDKGIYMIVEEAKDSSGDLWGKLLSGAGWISLKYTKKV